MFARMDEILSGRQRREMPDSAAVQGSSRLTYAMLETMPTGTSLFVDDNCVICYDDMNMPVVIPCRHVFCFDCIVTWASTSHRCPSCRQDIEFGRARSRWLKYVPPVVEQVVESPTSEQADGQEESRKECAQSSLEDSSTTSAHESSQLDRASTLSPSRARMQSAKMDWIVEYCESHPSESVIVYSNGASSFIADQLKTRNIRANAMLDSMSGLQRGSLKRKFESGAIQVLCLKYSV